MEATAQQKATNGAGGGEEKPPRFSLLRFLEARLKVLGDLAGEMIDAKKLVKTASVMASGDGRLWAAAEANPEKYFLALCKLTECGLEPDGVEAALIPYGDEIQAQPMYRGLVKLMYGSGLVKDVFARVVYANEVAQGRFEETAGTKPGIIHKPLLTDRGEPAAVYAVSHLRTGGTIFRVLSREEVEKRRAFSQSWASERTRPNSPWTKWPDEQWLKTALKALAKTAPSSDRLKKAIAIDNEDVIEAEYTREEPPAPATGAAGVRAALAALPPPTVKETFEPATPKETVAASRPTTKVEPKKAAAPPPATKAEPAPQAEPDPERVSAVGDLGFRDPPETDTQTQRDFDDGWIVK